MKDFFIKQFKEEAKNGFGYILSIGFIIWGGIDNNLALMTAGIWWFLNERITRVSDRVKDLENMKTNGKEKKEV